MGSDEDPLTPGIPNDELFRLIRRFDKQVSHVQAVPRSHVNQLDLNRSAEEPFPASKLQKTIERFYVSVVVKVGICVNHVNRLRSWKERRRTGTWFGVYLLAWLLDVIIPIISGVLVAMIFSPAIRGKLFPPLPENEPEPQPGPSDENHGDDRPHTDIHAPPANEPEAEHEAEDFVNGLTNSITEGITEPATELPPDAQDPAGAGTATLAITAGEEKPKKKTSPAITVTLKILSDLADLVERFSNVFSPSPPFRLLSPRLQIAGIFVATFLVSLLLSSHMIVKTVSLGVGLAFFGDPVMSRFMALLNEKVPNWKEYLDIDKTLLKGVPTNAQLTLSLLRIAELNSNPLPIPPALGSTGTDDDDGSISSLIRRKSSKPSTIDSSAETATQASGSTGETGQSDPNMASKAKTKGKKWLRIFRFAKRAITTAIKGHVAFNNVLAISGAGSKVHAKNLLSAVLDRNMSLILPPASLSEGPFIFEAKYERKRGTAVIDSSNEENPVLYFTSKNAGKVAAKEDLRVESQKEENVFFKLDIKDITELRKTEGLGWKGKLIVQIAAGGEGSTQGLIVGVGGVKRDKTEGGEGGKEGEGEGEGDEEEVSERKRFHLTGMRGRNQLFNRLVAGGVQCWEMY